MSVENVMTRDVFCASASDRVVDAWVALMERDISGAPVVDEHGVLVGVLSVTDVYKAVLERVRKARALRTATCAPGDKEAEERESLRELTLSLRAVAEAKVSSLLPMRQELLTLGPHDSLDRALRLIAEHNVNRLPVVREGKVVGIITRADIIAVFAGRKR
jgi:CBS domain-containing protein